jgi:uncharacterized protein YpmS
MLIYKTLRWFILAALVVTLGLFLQTPKRLAPPPQSASIVARNANSFQTKLGVLQQAHEQGEGGAEVRLTSDEVSAALTMANAPHSVQSAQAAYSAAASNNLNDATTLTPEQVGVKDPQVTFEGDEVKGQFSASVYGKDMFVTLSGHLATKDGYVTFNPTGFKIGDMPIPVSLVQAQLDKKFKEPETREKLKLPDYVNDMKIENGQLVITQK